MRHQAAMHEKDPLQAAMQGNGSSPGLAVQQDPVATLAVFALSLKKKKKAARQVLQLCIMAEPLSITASVASVVTICIQTCHYLGTFFSKMKEAPVEAQQCQLYCRALTAALYELEKTHNKLKATGDSSFPKDFRDRLESCKTDLQAMQAFVDGLSYKINGEPLRKTWARISYTLFADERLKKFMYRLQIHQASFLLDLMTANS